MKHSFVVPSGRVRYPLECARCHQPTRDAVRVYFSRRVRLRAPLCKACFRWRRRQRLKFLAEFVVIVVAFLVVCGTLTNGNDMNMAIAEMIPPELGLLYLALRGKRLFERLYSPVWIARHDRRSGTLTLAFRNVELMRRWAASSGVPVPPQQSGPRK